MNPSKKNPHPARRKLDLLYENFSREEFLGGDPVGALDRGLPWEDLEILSFLIAGLSYGRVENIHRSYRSLLGRLEKLGLGASGAGIAAWLAKTPARVQKPALDGALKGWVHRLNSASDLRDVLIVLGHAKRSYGSLAEVFVEAAKNADSTPKQALADFCARLHEFAEARATRKGSGQAWQGTGPAWFYASPLHGSTCKRLLMWLRWMSRKDAIDLGLWSERFPEHRFQERLFWPVDTHIHRWAFAEGITARKSVNWAFVEELTAWGRELCPEDPVRYDFVICQSGMRKFRGKF